MCETAAAPVDLWAVGLCCTYVGVCACRGQAETVKSIGKFFGAASGDAPHSEVTTDNAGEAAATILVAPAAHTGHIYTISSPHFTYNDVSAGVCCSGPVA